MFSLNQALSPIFLDIGPITIYWYAIIIVTGVVIGLILGTKESVRLGLKDDTFTDLIVWALPIAIVSARLYYVIFEWDRYTGREWWAPFAVWEGGIAIHGALIGSVIFAYYFCKKRGIPFYKLADIAAPSIIIGQAIGRWGNFMNQEAHGGPVSDWAYDTFLQYLPSFIENQMTIEGVLYHPTFLYESVWNLIIFGLLLYLRRVNPLRGDIFLTYVMGYSVGRFFIEGMRTDSLYVVGNLRTAQVISIVLIIVGIVLMYLNRKKNWITVHYNGKKRK
ncbi:phosphatidylglycerol:prolipoprotein diacylglycerol transferase [Halolactibacillus halophilus]|uniref:Phosphatidylglycerol--prolipoprotein diacylglyceryl transferase n=1 Tax=Halolactibacillus halophilus TaxID=306540 RepID=A0A1I5PJZ2_9BACI|nr:prolipoprotein diacylglyceryl transferase [Halolactibacillus halophilus]GEM02041.1 prolipoprotein diacylglyceryl transferase [Halolactibacillus halophilus]SFP34110.1 phosphatidylglycerol:prolipoprotein diacylglycerol transferase [Halolactibacillus halophilus]